jgi:hypothetical protein
MPLRERHERPMTGAVLSPYQEGSGKMSDSTIFLFGAIMYLIGLGAMLFKDEFARLGLRIRSRRRA